MRRLGLLLALLLVAAPVGAQSSGYWGSAPIVAGSGVAITAVPGIWYNCENSGVLVLPHANSTKANIGVRNIGPSGSTCSLNPSTDTINGVSGMMTLLQGQAYYLVDDMIGNWDAFPSTQSVPATGLTFTNGSFNGSGSTTAGSCLQMNGSNNAIITGSCGGGGSYPNGAPAQIGGFSAANTSEAETVIGGITLARTGTNTYTATLSGFTQATTASIDLADIGGL